MAESCVTLEGIRHASMAFTMANPWFLGWKAPEILHASLSVIGYEAGNEGSDGGRAIDDRRAVQGNRTTLLVEPSMKVEVSLR